jgi:hypothetical protein
MHRTYYFAQSFPGFWLVPPLLSDGNFTPTFLRFTFTGGSNVTLEGSTDPSWGWVSSHGQQVREKTLIINGRVLTRVYQWWDVKLQVNRPPGWGFQGITKGEIKHMKLWQVSAGYDTRCDTRLFNLSVVSPSPGVLVLVAPRTCTYITTRSWPSRTPR